MYGISLTVHPRGGVDITAFSGGLPLHRSMDSRSHPSPNFTRTCSTYYVTSSQAIVLAWTHLQTPFMHPISRLHFELLLLFGPVFACRELGISALNGLKPSFSDNMVYGVKNVGANDITPAYRLPQVPIDVEGYPIAPDYLKVEQVHVYVRHGEQYASLWNNYYISSRFR
jgi:hypothetical protein